MMYPQGYRWLKYWFMYSALACKAKLINRFVCFQPAPNSSGEIDECYTTDDVCKTNYYYIYLSFSSFTLTSVIYAGLL